MKNDELGEALEGLLGSLRHLDKGSPLSVPVPAVLGLTGPGAAYGLMHRDGLILGADHVRAWTRGKLDIQWQFLDHESCVPGPDGLDTSHLGVRGGVMITSFVFCFGAQVPAIQASRTLALDPVGSTGIALKSQPYCYGLRSSWPDDPQEGLWRIVRTLHPEARRWVVVSPEYASGWDAPVRTRLGAIAKEVGIELSFIPAPYGADDYSAVVEEMKATPADVYVLLQYGNDITRTTRELERQSMLDSAIFISLEYDLDQVAEVGHLWDGWYVGHEDYDAEHPSNPWSEIFVREYSAKMSTRPQNYAALMYSTAFTVAILIDRVLAFGGDLDSGDDFVRALELDPSFPHLYGGTPSEVGKLVMDLATHSPESLPLVALQAQASREPSTARRIATYDIGGRSIRFLDGA